jgi:hypothetical protein
VAAAAAAAVVAGAATVAVAAAAVASAAVGEATVAVAIATDLTDLFSKPASQLGRGLFLYLFWTCDEWSLDTQSLGETWQPLHSPVSSARAMKLSAQIVICKSIEA